VEAEAEPSGDAKAEPSPRSKPAVVAASPGPAAAVDEVIEFHVAGAVRWGSVQRRLLDTGWKWVCVESEPSLRSVPPLVDESQMDIPQMMAMLGRVDGYFQNTRAEEEAAIEEAYSRRTVTEPPVRMIWSSATSPTSKPSSMGATQPQMVAKRPSMSAILRFVESATLETRARHPIAVPLDASPSQETTTKFMQIVSEVTGPGGLPMGILSMIRILARVAEAEPGQADAIKRDFKSALEEAMLRV
jgi:hypothetical protein